VSVTTKIPYSTVKKHARALGYQPRRRLGKPRAATTAKIRTNYSGLPTLHEVLAQLTTGQNNVPRA
jgi:hypothetical protein